MKSKFAQVNLISYIKFALFEALLQCFNPLIHVLCVKPVLKDSPMQILEQLVF